MRFSDFDTYLRADHLQHSTTVTIERFEKITTHPRPGRTEMALAVHFKGKNKPLILSTLNRRKLGRDVRRRHGGKSIQLAVEQVTVAGQVKSVIRIRPALAAVQAASELSGTRNRDSASGHTAEPSGAE